MALCVLPPKPRDERLLDAHSILSRAMESAESFFDSFDKVRKARNAKGTPTDHEQDLLRAALVFAAAGLDSMVKQLVRDTLGVVVARDPGARIQFADHVQGRIAKSGVVDIKYLTQALLAEDSREHLKSDLIRDLTANSMQSKDQLLRVGAYFAIPAAEISDDLSKLKTVFDTRNQIAHEMDVLLGQINRSRRSRALEHMKDLTSTLLNTACAFYRAVEKKVAAG